MFLKLKKIYIYIVISVLLECAVLLHGFPKGSLRKRGEKTSKLEKAKAFVAKFHHVQPEPCLNLFLCFPRKREKATQQMYLSDCERLGQSVCCLEVGLATEQS